MTTVKPQPLKMHDKLAEFEQTKAAHTESVRKMNEIGQAITRCHQGRQDALEQGKEAETSWRTRFRSLRGALTEEMKQEHSQRIAQRELAEEFSSLIDELELDQQQAMLGCCVSGKAYVDAFNKAFVDYAESVWQAELAA
jgi:hypothetical protein